MQKRRKAMAESSLPHSFGYKIRRAFLDEPCPVCGAIMNSIFDRDLNAIWRLREPSIQHNVPISLGGRHELGNISVICKQCNITLQGKPTEELNAKEVERAWQRLNGSR